MAREQGERQEVKHFVLKKKTTERAGGSVGGRRRRRQILSFRHYPSVIIILKISLLFPASKD